jgi:hypothetical protein
VRRAPVWLLVGLACACASAERESEFVYRHNRVDYEEFRAHHPGLLEPNYLPFMAWRLGVPESDDVWLAFCRWAREDFPLPVHVLPPEIPDSMQDEIHPRSPRSFVAAVERALASWESELEGLVSFRAVPRDQATLQLRLLAEPAPFPDPGVKVLGTTPLGDACRVLGVGSEGQRLRVEFRVPEVWIHIADEFGLLTPDQVERVALHEIGHALGMRGHSPIPNDLMFERVREAPGRSRLSQEDAHSFVSLYALPNGSVYRRLSPGYNAPPEPPGPPRGPPRLSLAPHVDSRHGFEIQLPEGWRRIETPTGVVAIDGLTWDYSASMQLIVRRYPSIESYLTRHAQAHVRDGSILEQGPSELAGRPAFRLVVESADGLLVDDTTFVESGDGRVFVFIADCAPADCDAYRPWFQATLGSLEIWSGEVGGRDREYRTRPE